MNYIYIIFNVYTLTVYLTERYKRLHRHTPFFLNFNIENSIFYTLRNTLFSRIMFYPLFTVYLCIYT